MAFIKKSTTPKPNRTSTLLEFNIQFQAVQLQELLRRQSLQQNLKNSHTRTLPADNGNWSAGETDTAHNISSNCHNSTYNNNVPKLNENYAYDPVKILNNLTSINEIRNNIFIDIENEMDILQAKLLPDNYLICRVITPFIPSSDSRHIDNARDVVVAQQFTCVIDEPGSSNCLRLLINVVQIDQQYTNPQASHANVTMVEASHLLLVRLPIGSILLIRNPFSYFDTVTNALDCNLEDLVILDNNCGQQEQSLLNGFEWSGKIPSKYLSLDPIGDPVYEEPVNVTKAFEEEVKKLWTAQKYSEAVSFLAAMQMQSTTSSSKFSESHIEEFLAKSRQYHQQSTTGHGYPIHQWLTTDSPTSLLHLHCAEYEGPVCIQNIPNKGRGLVATTFIPRGSLILAKRGFVVSFVETELEEVTGSNTLSVYDFAAFNSWTDVLNGNKIAKRLAMEPEWGKEVYNLYAGPKFDGKEMKDTTIVDLNRIMEICKYNGIANRPGLSTNSKTTTAVQDCQLFTQQMTTGLWIRPAYINHSCSDANVFWKIWGDFLFVRSFIDIQPGQEILMSYRGGITQCSYLERRTALFNGMGFRCDCNLCRIESRLGKHVNQNIMDLLGEIQYLSLNLNGLGSDMYRLELVSIIDELNNLLQAAADENSGTDQAQATRLLNVYLYQPCKLLAMTLLAEVQEEDLEDRNRRDDKLNQVVQLLEKAHDLIQTTSDCSKSIGCCLDSIFILSSMLNEDEEKVRRWLKILKSNLCIVYGCSGSEMDCLDQVLDLFLSKCKISKKLIHCLC